MTHQRSVFIQAGPHVSVGCLCHVPIGLKIAGYLVVGVITANANARMTKSRVYVDDGVCRSDTVIVCKLV